MAEKVILEVDVKGLAASILEAQATVDQYKNSLEELTEVYGQNSKEVKIAEAQVKAATKEQKSLEGQLLRTTQATQAFTGGVIDLSEATDFNNNSIEKNRKLYNALYAEYVRADKQTRDKLIPSMKKLSDTLKEQEKAVGDTRRNVGNYSESIGDAFKSLNLFGKNVGSVIDPLKNMGLGFKEAGGGVSGLNSVLASSLIFAIVPIIQGVVSVFSKFDSVLDAVEDGMSGVNIAFDYMYGIINQVINGTLSLSDAFNGLGDGLSNAYDEGVKLSQALRDIEDAQLILNVQNAEANKQVDELLLKSRDRTKSERERIAVLDEASKIEEKNLQRNLELARQREEIATKELGRVIVQGLKDDEAKEKAYKAAIERINLERESANLQEKITIRRNALLDSIDQEEAKVEANRKARYDAEQSRLEKLASENARLEKLRIESLQQGLQKELSLYELAFESRIEDLRSAGLTEIQITDLKLREISEIESKYAEKRIASDLYANEQIAEQRRKLNEDLIAEADRAAQAQADNDLKMINTLTSFITDSLGQAAQLVNDFTQQNIDALERQFREGVISETQYNREAYDLKVKAFKETKALNITQAVIGTLQASLNAFNSGLQAGGPFGLVLGAIFAAAAAAFGGAQIALIAKQQPPAPQFAEGGGIDIGGKSHAQGGEDVYVGGRKVANVEAGEKLFVLKKTASRHIDALGGLNMAFGGRAWTDSPVSYAAEGGAITDGGFGIRQTSSEANTMATLNMFAKNIVESLPTPMVSVTEFEKVQTSKDRSVKVSEL